MLAHCMLCNHKSGYVLDVVVLEVSGVEGEGLRSGDGRVRDCWRWWNKAVQMQYSGQVGLSDLIAQPVQISWAYVINGVVECEEKLHDNM